MAVYSELPEEFYLILQYLMLIGIKCAKLNFHPSHKWLEWTTIVTSWISIDAIIHEVDPLLLDIWQWKCLLFVF